MKKSVRFDDFLLSFREIWKFDKRLLLVLFLEIIVSAVLPFPNILLSGLIIDSLVDGKDFSLATVYILSMFGTAFLLSAAYTLLRKIREYLFIRFTNKLQNDINTKCMNIDFEQFNDSSFQDRIMWISQIAYGNNFFTNITTVFETISRFITLIGVILIMTTISVWLVLIAMAVIILQSLLHVLRLRFDRSYQTDVVHEQRKTAYVSRLARDIAAKKDFVIFDMNDFILRKIEAFQKTMLTFDKRRIKASGGIELATFALSVAFQISAYLLFGISAFQGNISIGDFTVGVSSLITFMSATSFLTTNLINYNDSIFYIRRYKSFQKIKSKYDAPAAVTLDDMDLSHIEIEFRNVSFRYPNSTSFVLKNISLTIKNQEKLAIVGYNGAGKTTFALLLTRMYDPTEGSIFLNGVDIRQIRYGDYLKIFSIVNQDFFISAFSLLENIAKTDTVPQEERERIRELFRQNGLGERLDKLYRGLDTPVTKALDASGVDLSGGERQKIAIIRALYKDSPVLVLDEPTAALDPASEYEIYRKFAEMAKEKTTVLISHRIYSTRFCDKIAVIEKGEIAEYGSYDELMAQKGLYYDFFQKQADYFK